MPHIPCVTGSLASEEEWTITDEPRPASLENTPRATPKRMALEIPYPITPPPTERILNAPENISPKASPIWRKFTIIIISAPIM